MARKASAGAGAGDRDSVGTADRLHSAAIHLLRRLRREDAASGVAPARLSALSVLVFGGPMNLTSLAAAEQVQAPTMTKVVQALEADGLVRREPVAGDKRGTRLVATARGRRIMEEGRRRRVKRLATELELLPASDREVLERAAGILERIGGGMRFERIGGGMRFDRIGGGMRFDRMGGGIRLDPRLDRHGGGKRRDRVDGGMRLDRDGGSKRLDRIGGGKRLDRDGRIGNPRKRR